MPIISRSPVIAKGTTATFTLNINQLLQLSLVSEDGYFSDRENWSTVIVRYSGVELNQEKNVRFKIPAIGQPDPTADFTVSDKVIDNFHVDRITIIDLDDGYLDIDRSLLNVSDFDITTVEEVSGPGIPANLSLSITNGILNLSWSASALATSYKVFRGLSSGSLSEIASNVLVTSYSDTSVLPSTTYYYAVKAHSTTDSGFSSTQSILSAPSAPSNLQIQVVSEEAQLSWDAVTGAQYYKIFRGSSPESLSQLASNIAGDTYSDTTVQAGGNYYYAVKTHNVSDSILSNVESATIKPNTPLQPMLQNMGEYIRVSWSSVYGTTSYKVYKGTSAENLTLLTTTSDTEISDFNISAGNVYYYSIRAYNGVNSDYSTVSSMSIAPVAPSNLSSSVSPGSIGLSWTSTSGALSYRIFRGTSSGSLSLLEENVLTNSYTDSSVSANTTYYYAVRAYNGSSSDLSSETSKKSTTVAPSGLTLSIISNGVRASWSSTTGASSYKIFRGTSSGSLSLLDGSVSSNSFDDTNASANTTYYYAVKAYNGNDSALSSEQSILTPTIAPSNLQLSPSATQMDLSWDSVTGASYYKVYRGASEGSLSLLASNILTNSYSDTSVSSNSTYYYAVKSYNGQDSASSSAASSIVPFAAPTGLSVERVALNSNLVSFNKIDGAPSYRVYRGTSSGSLSLLGTATPGLSSTVTYSDTTAADDGSTYYYAVKTYNGLYSDMSSEVSILMPLGAPANLQQTRTKPSVDLTWDSVAGASSYKVYYYDSASPQNSTLIATVNTNSYSDTSIFGTTKYAIKSYNGKDSEFSSYISSGGRLPTAPTISSISQTSATNVRISFSGALGLGMNLLRKLVSESDSSFTSIGDIAMDATYVDVSNASSAAAGNYTYAIRCYCNSTSDSENSNKVSFKAIDSFSCTAQSNSKNSLSVSWSSPNGGDTFDVMYKLSSASSFTTISSVTSPYIISSLTAAISYDVKIKANNSIGDGNSQESSVSTAAPLATVQTGTWSEGDGTSTTADANWYSTNYGGLMPTSNTEYQFFNTEKSSNGDKDVVLKTTDSGTTWAASNMSFTNAAPTAGNNVDALYTSVGGKYVVVRSNNSILSSSDNINWTTTTLSDAATVLKGVAYGNGRYVAIASAGTNRFLHSTNGVDWTYIASPNDAATWSSIIYANSKFLAISSNPGTLTAEVQKITFTGTGATGVFSISQSGSTVSNIAATSTAAQVQTLVRAGIPTMANVTVTGSISTTGLTFTWRGIDGDQAQLTVPVNTLKTSGAVSITATPSTTTNFSGVFSTATSTDGLTWTGGYMGTNRTYNTVTWQNNKYNAMANTGYQAYSSDGIVWTDVSLTPSANYVSIAGDGSNVLISVGNTTTSRIAISTDNGSTWSYKTTYDTYLFSKIIYRNGAFIALSLGNPGISLTASTVSLLKSTDNGTTWSILSAPATKLRRLPLELRSIIYGKDYFMATGRYSTSRTHSLLSKNGSDWTTYTHTSPASSAPINRTTKSADRIVGVGVTGYGALSYNDGKSFIGVSSTYFGDWKDVTMSSNNSFIAIGGFKSSDADVPFWKSVGGAAWTGYNLSNGFTHVAWNSITYGTNRLVAVGGSNLAQERQTVAFSLPTNGGNFMLSYGGVNTASIAGSSLSASTLQTALRAIPALASVTVTKSGNTYTIAMVGVSGDPSQLVLVSNTINGLNAITIATPFPYPSVTLADAAVSTDDGVSWTGYNINNSGTSPTYNKVIYANSNFMAVGNSGAFAKSADGTSWTTSTISSGNNYQCIAYDGTSTYIALSNNGTNRVARSTNNGDTWTIIASADDAATWIDVTYANGKFVAVATGTLASGTRAISTMTSSDGLTWSLANSITDSDITFTQLSVNAMAYGDGLTVKVFTTARCSVNDVIYTTPKIFNCIEYGNGMFIATTTTGPDYIYKSTDGINWSPVSTVNFGSTAKISFCNGIFIVSGSSATAITSANGTSWSNITMPSAVTWNHFAWTGSKYLATGQSLIVSSTDLINWTTEYTMTSPAGNYIAIGDNGIIVIFTDVGTTNKFIVSSDNGATWTPVARPTSNVIYDVRYGNGIFICPSSDPSQSAYWSRDGVTWTATSNYVGSSGRKSIFDGTKFVTATSLGSYYYYVTLT